MTLETLQDLEPPAIREASFSKESNFPLSTTGTSHSTDETWKSSQFASEELDSGLRSTMEEHESIEEEKQEQKTETMVRRRSHERPKLVPLEQVKTMVLETIPKDSFAKLSQQEWEDIFHRASQSDLAEDIEALQESNGDDDVKDIISYISVYLQREARKLIKLRKNLAAAATVSSDSKEDGSMTPPSSAAGAEFVGKVVSDIPKTVLSRTDDKIIPTRTDSNASSDSSNESKIKFGRVEIRFYERILCDNPAVTSGPPIGIGWKYRIMKKDMTINAWEHRQQPNRRFHTQLVVPRHERTDLLYDLGYSQKEIAFVVRDVLRIKNKRKQTYNNLRWQELEETVETTRRRLKKALTLGMAGRKDKQMLQAYKKASATT